MSDNENLALSAIRTAMSRLGLTQEELASILGRAQPTISEVLRGRRSISPELALDFESGLNSEVSASDLLSWQNAFQLAEARKSGDKGEEIRMKAKLRAEFPISEMEKRGWIAKKPAVADVLEQALRFANGSPDLDQIRAPFLVQTLARQSATLGALSPTGCASRAWQYRVRELAEMTPVKPFDHDTFVAKGIPEIRGLVRSVKGIAQVPQILATYGVRFVIVQHLTGTKLDGAATWLDSEASQFPLIALTLRLGHIDSFWFNLAHELQHIKLRHAFSVDVDLKAGHDPEDGLRQIEDEANREAAEWLIPESRLAAFVQRHGSSISEASIMAFAQMVDVHPGVLVGMLQHRGAIPYSRFSNLKADVRKIALTAAMADGFDLPVVKRHTV